MPWVAAHSSGDVADFVTGYSANAFIASGAWEQGRELLLSGAADFRDEFLRRYVQAGLVTIALLTGEAVAAQARATELVASLDPTPGRHIDTTAHALLAIAEAAGGERGAGRAALAGAATTVRRRYTHIVSAWGLPITAAGVILAIEGRDAEAMRLLVAVGAHGRMWQARQEMIFVLHREYSQMVAERLGPDVTAQAWNEGEAMSVEDMQAAVDALIAEA